MTRLESVKIMGIFVSLGLFSSERSDHVFRIVGIPHSVVRHNTITSVSLRNDNNTTNNMPNQSYGMSILEDSVHP